MATIGLLKVALIGSLIMQELQERYQPPVNYCEKDSESYSAIGIPIEEMTPTVQYINKHFFHVGSKELFKFGLNKGTLKLLLGCMSIKYTLETKCIEGCLIYDDYSLNYFHWVNDALPKYFYLAKQGYKPVVFLPDSFRGTSFIEESLKLLRIEYLFLDHGAIVPVKKFLLPSYTSSPGVQHPVYFNDVANALKRTTSGKPNRKIFISRKNSSYRNLLPIGEIETELKKLGFEILTLEQLSFKKQVSTFSECSHLLGVHGAGLTNMAFLSKGAKVMEIRRFGPNVDLCYFLMAHTLGHPYYYFLGESTNGNQRLQEDNIKVDVSKFIIAVTNFIS